MDWVDGHNGYGLGGDFGGVLVLEVVDGGCLFLEIGKVGFLKLRKVILRRGRFEER